MSAYKEQDQNAFCPITSKTLIHCYDKRNFMVKEYLKKGSLVQEKDSN